MNKDFYIPSNVKKCKCCGKPIDLSFKDVEGYVYKLPKIRNKQLYDYFCSYSCYRKAQEIKGELSSRKQKAILLNKYNGVLSLQECETVEGMKAYMSIKLEKSIHIESRQDYDNFIHKYKKYYTMLMNDIIYGK